MDPTEQLLYAEEQREALIALKKSIDGFGDILSSKIEVTVKQPEEINVNGKVEVNTEKAVEISNLQELSNAFDSLSTNITKAIEDNAPEVVKEVTIKNAKDIKPDSVTINNISDLAKYFTQLSSDIKKNRPIIEIEKQEVVFPTQANKPIAVRLSDGKSWINTLTSAISSAGGSDFRNSNGVGTQVQLTANGAVPVDIQDATLTINGDVTVSSEVEVKNDSGNPVPVSSTTLATSAKQDETNALIGEVDANPTANTLLDRLKSIQTNTDGLEGLITTLNGYVDGLEALITSTNGYVDQLEGYIDTVETKLQSLIDQKKGATSTQTQVADSASSQTILASNANRIRATIVNDSTQILYLRESSSAATTSNYTWKVQPDGHVVIDDYSGALTGIWAANASGNAIVSEVTA